MEGDMEGRVVKDKKLIKNEGMLWAIKLFPFECFR
jgi:hypothetical protein